MRIGVAATPDVALPTLNWLQQTEHSLDLVITQPDKRSGRGQSVQQTAVADWADHNGIRVVKPNITSELIEEVEGLDLVVTIGYGVLIPESILKIPAYGFLNLHFSILPAYRGAAPAQRALLNGETRTGVTVFQLDKGMDTGPIFSQMYLDIQPSWRSYELLIELAKLGPDAVSKAISMIENGESPTTQFGEISVAPKIFKDEARIDFSKSPEQVVNLIRAFTYEPGAWTLWKGDPFKITSARFSDHGFDKPGQIFPTKDKLFVSVNGGAIEVLTVIPAGKKEMSAMEWARGARLIGGEIFG